MSNPAQAILRALSIVAVLVTVAACSSNGAGAPVDPTASAGTTSESVAGTGAVLPESVVLESADGSVTIEIPPGVLRDGDDVGIEVVEAESVAALDGAPTIGAAHHIRPAGRRLPEPSVVPIRLPAGELDGAGGVPVVVAVVVADGLVTSEPEGRTVLDRDGAPVHLSPVDRLGTLVLLDTGLRVALTPPLVAEMQPGDSFEAALAVSATPALVDPWPQYDLELRWSATGALSENSAGVTETAEGFGAGGSGDEWVVLQNFTCEQIGSGAYAVELRVDVDGLVGGTTLQFLRLDGEATCGDVGR